MSGTLHKDLTGADLHLNKLHADTHVVAGTDPLVLAESQVTDLADDLAGLVIDLAGKAPTPHTHTKSQITDFPILIPGTGNGDVVGPASVTPGDMATFADETGKNIQDGGAIPTLSGLGAEAVANKSTDVPADAASDVAYPSVKAVKDYTDGLVAGLLDYRGAYDAAGNAYPTTGGSGTAGAVMKGDMWTISVAGTLGGVAIQVGDAIIAKIDTPAQTAENWNILNTNVSYVPEDQANKENETLDTSTVKYPTNNLVKTGLDGKVASSDARLSDARVASDVSAWAKAGTKPSYASSEIGNITAAGQALIDDASAAAQLVTLGTAAYSEGTWTPVLNGATIVGAAPVLTGTYKKIGKIAFVTVTINGGSGGNTSVAFPVNQASINGFSPCPAPVGVAVDILSDDAWKSLGTCQVLSGALYLPAMTANTFKIYLTATYNTA